MEGHATFLPKLWAWIRRSPELPGGILSERFQLGRTVHVNWHASMCCCKANDEVHNAIRSLGPPASRQNGASVATCIEA